jgi:hypothetical protein
MRLILTALALAAAPVAATPAAAAPDPTVVAPTDAFLTAFDAGDMKAAAAAFATGDIAIIDEFAPFHWIGPTALQVWAADFGKYAKAKGQTGGKVVLGAATRVEVGATTAYVIRPAHYTFVEHGTAMVEDGQMTFALTGKAKAWKIAAWSWSGPTPKPGK